MKWAQFKKKLNINVPAGQGDELNCKKTTTFYHLYKLSKTILFCQHIKSSFEERNKKKPYISSIIPVLSYTHVLKHL